MHSKWAVLWKDGMKVHSRSGYVVYMSWKLVRGLIEASDI